MVTSISGQPVKGICKTLLVAVGLLTTLALDAQDLQSLVAAEKAFAQLSADKSVKAAFLEYFDRSTIAFNNGEPILGRKDWEKRKENNNFLFWWPIYADIAASGDFGYTTGPVVFGPDRTTKDTKGGIYYSSVWKKDINGNWKVLVDLGSSIYNPSENLSGIKTSSRAPRPVNDLGGEAKRELIALDRSYNEELSKERVSFDDNYFSDEVRVHRRGIPPLITRDAIKNYVDQDGYTFDHSGGHVASSNDMAVTYGTVKIITRKEGKDRISSAGYMRVWKIEDGEWSIVLDVIN
jgi:ketosteroid isomerase-like protein